MIRSVRVFRLFARHLKFVCVCSCASKYLNKVTKNLSRQRSRQILLCIHNTAAMRTQSTRAYSRLQMWICGSMASTTTSTTTTATTATIREHVEILLCTHVLLAVGVLRVCALGSGWSVGFHRLQKLYTHNKRAHTKRTPDKDININANKTHTKYTNDIITDASSERRHSRLYSRTPKSYGSWHTSQECIMDIC